MTTMQWLVEQWHALVAGGGVLGILTGGITMITAGRKRSAAALERETERERRMAALERRLDDRDDTITDLRTANIECERRGEECDRRTSQLEAQNGEQAEAIHELQEMLMRDGRRVRRPISVQTLPAVRSEDDKWEDD